MKPLCLFILSVLAVWVVGLPAHAQPPGQVGTILFQMADPIGDDRGDGSLSYPRDRAFHPYSALLDLTHFKVRADDEAIFFDLTMGALANPWNAPEGFFHPRIDIYIHTGSEGGLKHPLRHGPAVRFSPRYPWNVWLRVAPFGGTALFDAHDSPQSLGRQQGITVATLDHHQVITVRVERNLLPPPSKSWRYYVMVGSFDGFGSDGYRAVGDPGSQWLLGSDSLQDPVPIIDLLAPRWGPGRQERQLKAGRAAVLRPVGGFTLFRLSPATVIGVGAVLVLAVMWMRHQPWTRTHCR